MSIRENLNQLLKTLPAEVKLVAVSKTKPVGDIAEAYSCGQRDFGENKAQEMASKHAVLPQDIKWHFIGHLQTNKIKYLAPFVEMIHSVDSFKLLAEIDKAAEKNDRIIKCLLQFHIAVEETKFGLSLEEAVEFLESQEYKELRHVEICGVMGMATFTDNQLQISDEFMSLRKNFNFLKSRYFNENNSFREISMGMSDDFQIAVDCGSTIVRIGSTIFGERNYFKSN